MESSETGSPDSVELESSEKRTKLRRSCELCRASKGRCIPSRDDLNKCQKCLKDRKPCVFLEAKPRPKRSKNSRTRVAEMEQRLESLYAMLTSANEAKEKDITDPPPPPRATNPPLLEAQPSDPQELFTSYTAPRVYPEAPNFSQYYPIWSFPQLVFDDIQDVISKQILSFEHAEESLRFFRTKASSFPFVLISPQTSLGFLRREKPFLLLSILAYSAQQNPRLQQTLEVEIREQLSRKVVFHGEKSLELLQGVLIYLCWYQYYFKPERQQIYQLSQMAASMAIDLGLNQPVPNASQQNNFAILNVTPHIFGPRQTPEEIEAKRTFVGCYYLSSAVALGLRKPTGLRYSEYVGDCAQALAQASDAASDFLLPHFVALQKCAEDINHAFDYNTALQHPELDSTRVEILSKTFEQQLDQLHSTFPPHVWDNVQISMSYHFLRIYINEVGFHAAPPSALELMTGGSTLRGGYHSNTRNDSLIACLQAAKDYLDRFIELTPSQAIDFTLPDYLRSVYAVLILGRFTTGCDCPVLDASSICKTANLGYYLEKLIQKSDDMILLSTDGEVNDTFYHMRKLWKSSKNWFDEIAMDPAAARDCAIEQAELNFMEILPSAIGKCVDFSGAKGSCDMWCDMVDVWPASLDPSVISINGGLV